MSKWLQLLLSTILFLSIGSYTSRGVLAEEVSSQADSQASVSFLPAPEVPLTPEVVENESIEEQVAKPRPTQNLPQTGEKRSALISGLVLITSVGLMSYIRRKLLDYKL